MSEKLNKIIKNNIVKVVGGTLVGVTFLATLDPSMAMLEYGGFSGDVNHHPSGTVISDELTDFYKVPVCVNESTGEVFWHKAGVWYNHTEMMDLPSETHLYGTSPYALGGGNGGGYGVAE